MPRNDPPLVVFITCALSHMCIIPTINQFLQKHWLFEAALYLFGTCCSFMYHLCQAFDITLFLDELHWHRLDNITAISTFGVIFIYLSVLRDPTTDFCLKIMVLFIAIVVQERDPWNIAYTVVPIGLFAIIPCLSLILRVYAPKSFGGIYSTGDKRIGLMATVRSLYEPRNAILGVGLLCCAIPFFVAGLDDDNDPCRIFHGLWHVFGSLACFYIWKIVKKPEATSMQGMVRLRSGDATKSDY
eukprot:Tbor_TRINITY_DN3699_c0_g1::TRINITY_DN3699_c0_g1_i4::g.370::m.370